MLNSSKLLQMEYEGLRQAINRIVPAITEHLDDIFCLIDDIPEEFEGISICSKDRKEFYKAGLRIRYEKLLLPAYRGTSSI